MKRTNSYVWAAVVVGALAGLSVVGSSCANESNHKLSDGSSTTTATMAVIPVIDPGDGGTYAPTIDPANFVAVIDNPYLPLIPGTKRVYEGTSDGENERIEVVVTNERKEIAGISAVVVRDTVWVSGELVEDTFDWFAQDKGGNVWYLGEAVKDYDNGELVSTAGSWEAGVNGARAGLAMPAHPTEGLAYRQEFAAGEAEDMAEVLRTDATGTVLSGSVDRVLVVREWTPLEPDVIEEKSYAPGIGNISGVHVAGGEGTVHLVELSTSG